MYRKVVVSLSGGMDSSVLLARSIEEFDDVLAVSFDYGQRHRRELESAKLIAQHYDVPHFVLGLSSVFSTAARVGSDSSLLHKSEVPHGHYTHESMTKTVVPNRNMVFLSCLASVALSAKASAIGIAAHNGDHAIYPDCRPKFLHLVEDAIRVGSETSEFSIYSPFIYLSKGDIAKQGFERGVPFEKTWSCYEGQNLPCGRCGTCVERLEAFWDAGQDDPLIYQDGGITYAREVLRDRHSNV